METNAVTVIDGAGKAVTLWQDNRSGTDDIYGAAYSTMGNFVKAGVSVTVTSQKAKRHLFRPAYQHPQIPADFYQRRQRPHHHRTGAGRAGVGGHIRSLRAVRIPLSSYDLPSPITVPPGGAASIVINVNQ